MRNKHYEILESGLLGGLVCIWLVLFSPESEREAFRLAHHEKMQERAKERGLELPDEPMERKKNIKLKFLK